VNFEDIEALRRKLWRIFDPQGIIMFPIRSLTPQQATGNALATGFRNSITSRISEMFRQLGERYFLPQICGEYFSYLSCVAWRSWEKGQRFYLFCKLSKRKELFM